MRDTFHLLWSVRMITVRGAVNSSKRTAVDTAGATYNQHESHQKAQMSSAAGSSNPDRKGHFPVQPL
jgi:hypothetical protein